MKLSCTKENLSKALSLVSGVTGKNLNLPILSNVMIKADEQKTEIIATNLELAIVVNIRSKVEVPGAFTVPARTLLDYISLMPNEKIDLELKENELIITCGKSSTKIKGTSSEDYPVIPVLSEGEGYLISAEDLKTGLGQVLPAMARNDIRPELSGAFFGFKINGENTLTMAATDSYRLAEKKIPLKQGNNSLKIIVPGHTATEIVHMLGLEKEEQAEQGARLLVGESQIMVSYGNAQIISRLVEGQYPDYTQIIPKEFNTTATVETVQMVKEMKASGLFTTTGVNAATLAFRPTDGTVQISSVSTQTGEYHSEMNAEITGSENSVLLNNKYVLDGVNNFGSPQTKIKLVNGDSPCIFSPAGDESYLYIVMPIRQ